MGVYINGLDMPISCEKCPLCYDYLNCSIDDSLQMYLYNRHPNCPLIEIGLVRCGECKYFDYEYGWCKRPKKMSFIAEPTDFCSYGERNEDFDPYQGERDRDENGEIY